MDENEAVAVLHLATPIFNVYRRGYDPEQVDRYVADQQRRLNDALRTCLGLGVPPRSSGWAAPGAAPAASPSTRVRPALLSAFAGHSR